MDGSAARGRLVGVAPDVPAGSLPRRLDPGPLGVRLVVDGLPVEDLPAGTRLRVGESALLVLAGGGASASGPAGAAGVAEADRPGAVSALVVEGGPVRAGDAVAIEAVPVPLEDVLDLHSFRPDEAGQVVRAYLAEAQAAGLREVRIVHGRGRGVQRALVQRLLAVAPEVAGFGDAAPERGGWGATVVRLRRAEEPRGG